MSVMPTATKNILGQTIFSGESLRELPKHWRKVRTPGLYLDLLMNIHTDAYGEYVGSGSSKRGWSAV